MRVGKREFAGEFSKLSFPRSNEKRVASELTAYYCARSENSRQFSLKFEPSQR